MRKWLFIVGIGFMIWGCQTSKKNTRIFVDKPLVSTHWQLEAIEKVPISYSDRTTPYIIFDTNSRYHGNFGCNRFFGAYEVKKNNLTIKYDGATKMLCEEMLIEKDFYKSIKKKTFTYKIDRNTLRLFDHNMELLQFVAIDSLSSKKN